MVIFGLAFFTILFEVICGKWILKLESLTRNRIGTLILNLVVFTRSIPQNLLELQLGFL